MTSVSDTLQKNVLTKTVAQDLCVGCGVCAGVCPYQNLTMSWTPNGQYHPCDGGHCRQSCHRCLDVCPFQNHGETEDTLAKGLYGNNCHIQHTPETGYYLENFVGYAHDEYRERGASGGMASWILSALLEHGKVDRIICVQPNADPHKLFRYVVLSTVGEVQRASKSAYYPVELSEVIQVMLREDGRYAIVGLPCFLKALRLAALKDHRLHGRIVSTVGLVCGQLKTKRFAEYLANSLCHSMKNVKKITFRNKDYYKPASELIFTVETDKNQSSLTWSSLYGQTWCSGEFKLRSCDFCDDIFAEVADVTCMDAWLPRYIQDGRGTSIVLVRSEEMHQLLRTGIAQADISLEHLSIDQVIASQAGVVSQKRSELAYRLWLARENGSWTPEKRVQPSHPSWLKQQLLVAREELRLLCHSSTDPQEYHVAARKLQQRISRLQAPEYYRRRLRRIAARIIRILKGL